MLRVYKLGFPLSEVSRKAITIVTSCDPWIIHVM